MKNEPFPPVHIEPLPIVREPTINPATHENNPSAKYIEPQPIVRPIENPPLPPNWPYWLYVEPSPIVNPPEPIVNPPEPTPPGLHIEPMGPPPVFSAPLQSGSPLPMGPPVLPMIMPGGFGGGGNNMEISGMASDMIYL